MIQNFTRRYKLDRPDYDLKYEYIPPSFRFDLYKLLKEKFESSVQEYCLYRDASISINKENFRLYSVEEVDEYYNPDVFVELLQRSEWHEVLSLVEFFVNVGPLNKAEVNELFEYHKVGYRVEDIDMKLVEVIVHYESLIEENEKVLEFDIPYPGVPASIEAAKRSLINPNEIDYANSLKNSIDAVEGYLKGWLLERNHRAATLGDCIKIIKQQNLVPVNIINALEQFYIFRNLVPYAGHGSEQLPNIKREDALLCNEMAISFINYFFRKQQKT